MLICICGDSFFSLDFANPNTHWSELLNLSKNIKIKNLAITGASNINIRAQIKYAVHNLKADKIIFTATNHNRLDLPKDKLFFYYNKQPYSSFNNNGYLSDTKFYENFWNPKFVEKNPNKWVYRSMSLITAQTENKKNTPEDFQKNFDEFFVLLRDDSIELEKDYCVIQQTINEYREQILLFDPRFFNRFDYKFDINEDKIVKITNRFKFNPDTTYHTTVEEQKILAEEIKEKLKNLYNIY